MYNITLGSGSGSKLGQNYGSGSRYNELQCCCSIIINLFTIILCVDFNVSPFQISSMFAWRNISRMVITDSTAFRHPDRRHWKSTKFLLAPCSDSGNGFTYVSDQSRAVSCTTGIGTMLHMNCPSSDKLESEQLFSRRNKELRGKILEATLPRCQ